MEALFEMGENSNDELSYKKMGTGIAIGLAIGISVGVALGNFGLGIAIGTYRRWHATL